MNQTVRRILICCALIGVFITGAVVGQNKFGEPKSLLHVVTLKWKPESTAEQRQKAIDGVKTMAGQIPGIKNVWLKTVKVQGPSREVQFDAAFVIEFASEEALKVYATHPAHKKWEEVYLPVREESRTHDIGN